VHGDKVTLVTKQVGNNYTRFKIRLLEDPTTSSTTAIPRCFVRCPAKRMTCRWSVRCVCIFVTGSPPQQKLATLHEGDEMKVIGVPRIDLALVRYRVEHAQDDESLLTRSLLTR